MLKFDKKYKSDENVLASIYDGEKLKGYIYFEECDDDSDSDSENSDRDENDDPRVCEYCNKRFSCKKARETHQSGTSCRIKMLNDYVAYSYKGKKIDPDISLMKHSVKLSGDLKFKPVAKKKRENLLIMGPQDSGKSYYGSMYAKSYQQHIGKDVILVSRIEDDDSFSKNIKNPIRLNISEELLDDPIDIKQEFMSSLVIFDDIDDSRNSKDLNKYLWNLNTETLVNGRDQSKSGKDVYTVTTIHITDGMKTRSIVNEATSITMFLPFGYQEKRILKLYAGLSPNQITKISKLKSRWVSIYHRVRPQYVLTEKQLMLLSEL